MSTETSTETTTELAREFFDAKDDLEIRRRSVRSGETDLANRQNALGKRIDPGDMEDGEEICLWVRVGRHDERLLVCQKIRTGTYAIRVRAKRKADQS